MVEAILVINKIVRLVTFVFRLVTYEVRHK